MNSTLGPADIERCKGEDRCCERDGAHCQRLSSSHPGHAKSCDSYSESYFLADSFLDSFLVEFLSSTAIR